MEVIQGEKKEGTVIKIKDLLNPDFANSLSKFVKMPTLGGKDLFRVKKLDKKLKDALKIYNEARIDLAKSHAEKDEKTSEPKVSYLSNGEESIVLDKTKESDFGKKLKELQDVEILVTDKFPISTLGENHGLSGRDLSNLEFITED
jgi:hypothetical protein